MSPRAFDCEKLLSIGTVYGCNAQYREFDPHYVVAVDVKMVNEMVEANYHQRVQYGLIQQRY